MAALRQQGLGIRFLTNIDSKSPVKVAGQLAGCGLDVPVEDLFTPVSAAREFFALAARSLGVSVLDCVVVGDDATTDIAGGRDAGARTVQVRTGKFTDQQAEGITGSADVTIASIADLPRLLSDRSFS